MKIYIKADKKIIFLLLPNYLLKTALFDKVLYDDEKTEPSKEKKKENRVQLFQAVKNYIKRFGHFTLVEARMSDGERVIIKV